MALVDTQGFVLAIDRSLFGPQERRWIERRLPDVATNMACIVLYTFGACVLVYHICCDYNTLGSRGCLEMIPKHVFSAVAIHVVAIVLRWKIERMLRLSFRINDEICCDYNTLGSTRGCLEIPKHVFSAVAIDVVAIVLRWKIERMLRLIFRINDEALPNFSQDFAKKDAPHVGQSKTAAFGAWASGLGGTAKDRSDSTESATRDGVEVLSHDDHVERPQSVELAPGHEEATATVRTEAAVAGGDAARDAESVDQATATATAAATAIAGGAAKATGGPSATGKVKEPSQYGKKGEGTAGCGRWGSIRRISKAFTSTMQRRGKQGGMKREPRISNFFAEADKDELLTSTFVIKMCDDASWLSVEDRPHEPEMRLMSRWRGYKIVPRFQGEVKPNEADRMLFQCEKGKHADHVRLRSRATKSLLFFMGIQHTWAAWERNVIGGEWEDVKLEWVGSPPGHGENPLLGDERGRLIIYSRPVKAYVSWNGSRFTHVPNKEGATVFMFQRVPPRSDLQAVGTVEAQAT